MTESDKPRKPFRQWYRTPLGYVAIAILGAIFSVALFGSVQYFYQVYFSESRVANGILDNPATAEDTGPVDKGILIKTANSFRKIAREIGPAVVSIKSTKEAGPAADDAQGIPNLPEGHPFFEFFERFGQPYGGPQNNRPQVGLGSGIIMDERGYVVTNNHVVEGATEVVISLDGQAKEYKAEVIGTDPKTDLAVLKVSDLKDLPTPAKWADSEKVEVGDWAVAIGSPFALGQSVTVGIISAKGGRNPLALAGAEYGGDLLQTDAAINPGNSGGPLCDIEGNVMGVNTAIYTRSGGYMGIGFAIPSNLAKSIVTSLIEHGKIIRGWLGVYIQPLPPELAQDLGIDFGVAVHEVVTGSPAADAGIQPGDVITKVDDVQIKTVNQLQGEISKKKPQDKVSLEVVSYANKKSRSIAVTIGELPDESGQTTPKAQNQKANKLGMVLSPTRKKDGLLVEMIQPGSIATKVGIEVGDIITSANRKKVGSVAAFESVISKSKRLYLVVQRKGRKLFFQFAIPD